jgi:2-polyprenyl-3-methyl-5-hydroxy-6-metoxy-1,4-benzoquinol methylase
MRTANARTKKSRTDKAGKRAPRAQAKVVEARACWCGNSEFVPFGPEYGECRACGTLVYLKDMPVEEFLVRDDETDYYGKKYWLEHQKDAFGYPDIYTRARRDLPERNLHWLKTLLKYRLPPAEVLEVGCAHGSFVALMGLAGYRASGVELSPWVAAFGQQSFGISVHTGPVESLDLPKGSLDVIVLMDVLEHLPRPAATMRQCLELLKPEGLLLVQTPCFKEGESYPALVESKDRFLEMLIPVEHLYLFNQRSVTEFFRRLGAEHISFEPAIFDHYDMFFAVSREPLVAHSTEEIESVLLATPNGRMALALLDLREFAQQQIKTLTGWAKDAQVDSAKANEALAAQASAHAAEMAKFGEMHEDAVKQIETLTAWVHEAREANAALQKAMEEQKRVHAAQTAELNGLNRSALTQIETLTAWVHEAREANAALQKAMEEQKHAHAREVGALRELMARPMLKLALGVSNMGDRLVKRGGDRR